MKFCVWVMLYLVFTCADGNHRSRWRPSYPLPVPQDVMVDTVNYVGLALLRAHNQNSINNNIALSPYGATSVMAVLSEGVQGVAFDEIVRASFLPLDPVVTRIGLRDIHRHLKSYFIPQEGFLAGLTFSHDNIALKREYEDLLRFYGFDIESFNTAFYTGVNTTTTRTRSESTTQTLPELTNTPTLTTTPFSITTSRERAIESSSTKTTTNIISTTQTLTDTKEVPNDTTFHSSILPENEKSTSESMIVSTTKINDATTTITNAISLTVPIETTAITETVTMSTLPYFEPTIDNTTTTQALPQTTKTISLTTSPEDISTIKTESSFILETSPTESVSIETTTKQSAVTEKNLLTTVLGEDISVSTREPEVSEESALTSTTQTGVPEENLLTSTMQIEVSEENILTTTDGPEEAVKENTKKRSVRSVVDSLFTHLHSDVPLQQSNEYHYKPQVPATFAVHGKTRESNISFMTYDTILPYRSIAYLDAAALVFPLDSTNYYLLLVLPNDLTGIDNLINNMMSTTLKQIVFDLQPTRVKATIPSFMLKGRVLLTNTFQQLGICEIFEPRHADFSPMTADKEVYVTNIEQAVTVTIRNYVDPATLRNNDDFQHRGPVQFVADHPFLYFVMDAHIHVALMAGKITNPLNSSVR